MNFSILKNKFPVKIFLLVCLVFLSGCGLALDPAMEKRVQECMAENKVPVYTNNGFSVFFTCVEDGDTVSVK